MANMYHLQKFLARCELFIMKHYHTNPSSKAFLPCLSPESQLRIYRCGGACQTILLTPSNKSAGHISSRDTLSLQASSSHASRWLDLHRLPMPTHGTDCAQTLACCWWRGYG